MKNLESFQLDSWHQTISESMQQQFQFPSGSTWIVYTDQASHAAMSGLHLLEQTFHLPSWTMQNPELTPLKILEKHFKRKLV